MKTLLIIYHSVTGGTATLAQAAAEAAKSETQITTHCVKAHAVDADMLLAADGYIFASPENLAGMSGLMKDFFDRCYYPALDRLNGRAYASIICAGTDGHGAAAQIARIAKGWRLKSIADPLIIVTGAQTPEAIQAPAVITSTDKARAAEIGLGFASGLAQGIF